jgi:tetratricopeptide (TPR) repeat protein
MVRKTSFALSSYEIPQLENYYFQKGYSRLLSLPLPGFAVVGPLGLLGLAMSLRRRKAALLGIWFSVYIASVIAFFVVARYRLPVVPALIAGACFAATELFDRARTRRWSALLAPACALAAMSVLVNANLWGVDRAKAFAQSHFRVGIVLGERGLVDEAIAEYRRSIEIDPAYPQSYLNMGALLAQGGRTVEAALAFRRALALDPGLTAARLNLAMALGASGDHGAALAQLDSLLAGHPLDAAAHKERGIVLHRLGRDGEAMVSLREAARVDSAGTEAAEVAFYVGMIEGRGGGELPPDALSALALADSLIQAGRAREAVSALERAAALAPRSGEPLLRLASLQRDLGLGEQALATATRALDVDPVVTHGHFARGVLLSGLGRHDEAILEYEAETRLFPDFAPAHLNLAITHRFHTTNSNRAAYHYRRFVALSGERIPDMEAFVRELGAGHE